jgi:hypothetical protein
MKRWNLSARQREAFETFCNCLEEVKTSTFAAKNAAKMGHPVLRGVNGFETGKARSSGQEQQSDQNR